MAGADHLARRLATGDAVLMALGLMIGLDVSAALGPAARAADTGLLIGTALLVGDLAQRTHRKVVASGRTAE